jgi:predicted ribosome quality control (RQC) complex YloA/Tae2 family protein
LDDIIQPGNDRAVYFCFGDLRLCLELFQAGNMILFQASDLKILAVQRYHVIQGTTIIGVNQSYTPEQFRNYVAPTDEEVHAFLRDAPEKTKQKLRNHFSKIFPFHRHEFFVHGMTLAGIHPIEISVEDYVYDADQVTRFIAAMRPFDEILLSKPPERPPRPPRIEGQEKPEETEKKEEAEPDENIPVVAVRSPCYIYQPKPKEKYICGVQLAHWDPKFVRLADNFDVGCDQLWSLGELEQAQKERKQVESIPQRKVMSVQRNFEKKKKELQEELAFLNKVGALIQRNAEEVEQCRMILNSLIGTHIRWDEIRASIRAYQEGGNELARMIDKVEFEKRQFWVLLTTEEGEIVRVLIDLRKTAFANASSYYDKRTPIAEKLTRTEAKEAEVVRKVDREAQASKKKAAVTIQERRKTWWFERFHWFISSENYLVLAGRDRIQNDVLVKHYLRRDDVYLHAEIHGAASVVVKNPGGKPVSPITLKQAAEFAVSRSTAWKSNEPCQCFWVYAWQVRKNVTGQQTAPTGAFYIVGEKNMMTMTMPQMGIGVLFHVTETHVAAHHDERKIRVDDDESASASLDVVEEPVMPQLTEEEIEAQLALPVAASPDEHEGEPEPDAGVETSEEEAEMEEDDGEEELTDEELMRIALEEPERADVARRRLERRAKRNRPKVKKVIEPEVVEVMESEGISVDIDIEGINALTGLPRPEDEFYAAYPMVAPLSALLNFKYKVKFQPGDTKKGKAWPVIRDYFTSVKGVPPEQTGLIKLIPETDVINLLPFNLKVILGAGGTAVQKKRQGGKGKKKGRKK